MLELINRANKNVNLFVSIKKKILRAEVLQLKEKKTNYSRIEYRE
jgi:hypothetical protein